MICSFALDPKPWNSKTMGTLRVPSYAFGTYSSYVRDCAWKSSVAVVCPAMCGRAHSGAALELAFATEAPDDDAAPAAGFFESEHDTSTANATRTTPTRRTRTARAYGSRMANVSRRTFLGGMSASALLAACSSSSRPAATASSSAAPTGLPDPSHAPFDTVVVLMMENRSFDHMLGWLPGANGKQAGLSYPDAAAASVPTFDLGSNVQGCAFMDPKHDWESVAAQYSNGACDGWLKTQTSGDHFPVGYYTAAQVPVLGALAQNYTVFDNYFCSLLAATWPNRFYQLCAATDVDQTGVFPGPNEPRPSQLELSIFDRLAAAGRTAGYYSWGEPMTGLFASKRYDSISFPKDQFFADAAAGRLPNVTFIEPNYTLVPELTGTSNDEHPHGRILAGEGYIADVYNALRASPQWDRTVFVLNFDEHGGFFDHVVPPTVVDDNVNANPGP